MIAINHPGLANKMAKTKWGRANLRNLLMQLDGAVVTASPRSFGGLKKRAVVIPYETLTAIGVEFSDDEQLREKWHVGSQRVSKLTPLRGRLRTSANGHLSQWTRPRYSTMHTVMTGNADQFADICRYSADG